MTNRTNKKLVTAALLAAMTCISTMIIKFPTPTFGYIHLGDGLVLLCGILLGPILGGFTAGIGSMFADIFSGYIAFAPATLIIKALTAGIAGLLYHRILHTLHSQKSRLIGIILGGITGEAVMILGYFLYETGVAVLSSGSFQTAALTAGIAASAAGIPFNLIQAITGIIISALLVPVLCKIPSIRTQIET